MKAFGRRAVAAALVLSFTTLCFAQAPMGAPAPAMPGKGGTKGETAGGGLAGERRPTGDEVNCIAGAPDRYPVASTQEELQALRAGHALGDEGAVNRGDAGHHRYDKAPAQDG